MNEAIFYLKTLGLNYGIDFLFAILILFIGRWVAKRLKSIFQKMLRKSKLEETIINFLSNLVYGLLVTFLVLIALNQIGIETTSFIAILGAAGLAVGFALKDSLSNFASGVMILIFKQFKVGDYIEAGGTNGTVNELNIFFTKLTTPDNKVIYVPNANIMSGVITNFSENEYRRVDLVFGIGYSDDIDKAKQVISEILKSDTRILSDPEPTIWVSELADSCVNFFVRPWVKKEDYWTVYTGVTEMIKKKFDENNISIPFPQKDVHLFQN